MSAYVNAIAAHLVTAGLAGGSTGWTVSKLRSIDTPDQLIVVRETGGLEPEQATDRRYRRPTFQIEVRGSREDAQAPSEKAEAILTALDRATVSGFTVFRAQQSTPFGLGLDGNGRPSFAVNFRGGES